jgi:hypothetical protein
MNDAPILYLVFNRPDLTEKSFQKLKKVRPKKLYIAADGPRKHYLNDINLCQITRELIINGINWPCEIHTLFREENLGCRESINSALDWFFTHEEKGLIIEDDILISDAFIKYSNLMLEKYYNNEEIFSINGNSMGYETPFLSIGKTNYFNMWGWATWRRSWIKVKETWQKVNTSNQIDTLNLKDRLRLFRFLKNSFWFDYWFKIFRDTKDGLIDTWDYQWVYTALLNKQMCIYPTRILVQNIGFNSHATHTKDEILSNRLGRAITLENFDVADLMKLEACYIKEYEIKSVLHYWNMFDKSCLEKNDKNIFSYMFSYLELMCVKKILKE